jgi:hypothetical protein
LYKGILSVVDCKERVRLLREYSNAAYDASVATTTLTSVAGTSALADYTVLLAEQERTETKARRARAAYEQHILTHRCSAPEIQT